MSVVAMIARGMESVGRINRIQPTRKSKRIFLAVRVILVLREKIVAKERVAQEIVLAMGSAKIIFSVHVVMGGH